MPHGPGEGQVIRRWAALGRLSASEVDDLLADFLDLPLERLDHGPFMAAAMVLRHNLTFSDALYLAVAAGLDATLLTADRALGEVPDSPAHEWHVMLASEAAIEQARGSWTQLLQRARTDL